MSQPLTHHAMVLAQLGGVAAATIPLDGVNLGAGAWLLVAAAGIALGIVTLGFNRIGNFSIYPRPRSGARLVTDGPYRWIRHPMYSALMLMMIGIAGYNGRALNALGAVVCAVAVILKSRAEERFLLGEFEAYADYRARTRRFIPFVI